MKRTVLSCLPLVPIAAHWLLPDSIETNMYLVIGGIIPFFIFNICYFLYILNYKSLVNEEVDVVPYKIRVSTIVFITIYFLYSFIHGILNGVDDLLVLMTNNQAFAYSLILFLLHPMDGDMIERTKYIVIPVAILLSIEVLLFSLGILQYSVDLHSAVYGNVMRISTTIGAATGSAVVLVMLGVMLLYYSGVNIYLRVFVLILNTIAIFLLQSIGGILVWVLYLLYYLYVNYFREYAFDSKIKNIIIFGGVLFCLFRIGTFQPIMERYSQLEEDDNIGTGRSELIERAMTVYSESGGFGVGLGQTNYDKSLRITQVKRAYPIGVHNYYICVLAELGFWGLSFLLIYLFSLIKYINFNNPISFYILLLFSITFCLEPIFSYSEFTCFAIFILMVSIKKVENEDISS